MNERIKELALQAGMNIVDDKFSTYGKFAEKFAELIVQECSKVIVNGGYWSGGPLGPKRQCTPPEIATMIKQHFGVEE
jgi:hypothetical protein